MAKPAIIGGKPLLNEKFRPSNTIGKEEKEAVMGVLDTGILSGFVASSGDEFLGGEKVIELERNFCSKFNIRYAVSTNSATTSLNTAVAAIGLKPGDEVIVPPYTMSATATAVLLSNAIPVFADIDDRTFNIDPLDVKKKITERTKAIIAVNLFGQPAELDKLKIIAEEHNLKLIEDNAQAPGSKFDGKYAGTIGDMGVFSFNKHKVMQCGEGGVLVTNSERIATRARLIRNHGEVVLSLLSADKIKGNEDLLGNNYRLAEPLAAVAVEQLKRLDFLNKKRQELADYLTERLNEFSFITPPFIHKKATHVYYLYSMKFDEKKAGLSRGMFTRALQAENLPIAEGYVKPIYLYPFYQNLQENKDSVLLSKYPGEINYSKGICPVTERMHEVELITSDICRYPLTKKEIDLFIEGISKVIEAKDDLNSIK